MKWEAALYADYWVRIGIAVLCGFIVGLERQLRGKPAGIRTSILVCVGSMTFVRLGSEILNGQEAARVLAQVVTGVGFLGAGVILTRDGLINGVTSATVIWVLSAVGSCVGLDQYGIALATSIVVVIILIGVELLEAGFQSFRRGVHAHFDHYYDSQNPDTYRRENKDSKVHREQGE